MISRQNFKMNDIHTREYRFSIEEMKMNQIMGVYNAAYSLDDVMSSFDYEFADTCTDYHAGETNLIDRRTATFENGKVRVVSVIVFVDVYFMQLFLLRNEDYMKDLRQSDINGMLN